LIILLESAFLFFGQPLCSLGPWHDASGLIESLPNSKERCSNCVAFIALPTWGPSDQSQGFWCRRSSSSRTNGNGALMRNLWAEKWAKNQGGKFVELHYSRCYPACQVKYSKLHQEWQVWRSC
jgi:hypothetical protein